jgi:hypothetical protein
MAPLACRVIYKDFLFRAHIPHVHFIPYFIIAWPSFPCFIVNFIWTSDTHYHERAGIAEWTVFVIYIKQC